MADAHATSTDTAMRRGTRFAIGGLGGLLPIIAGLITVDLAVFSALIDRQDFTLGICVGYAVRVLCLFVLGGIIAALNSEVTNPMSLVQIGIAAPALVTSYLNGAALVRSTDQNRAAPETTSISHLFISPAHAQEGAAREIRLAGGFFGDVLDGLGGNAVLLDRAHRNIQAPTQPSPSQPPSPPSPIPDKLVPVQGPSMEVPGMPGMINFIVVNTELNSCIATPAPTYIYEQLRSTFPPPTYVVTTGSCRPEGSRFQ